MPIKPNISLYVQENPGHLANGHLANGHLAKGHLTNGHLANGHLANISRGDIQPTFKIFDYVYVSFHKYSCFNKYKTLYVAVFL